MDAMDIEEEETFAVNDPIKLTDTRLKKPVAQTEGYEYKFNHAAKTTGRCYWRCTKNVSLKCPAVIYTDETTDGSPVTEIKNKHNHAGDFLDYFEDTFLGRPDGNGGLALDLPRTSNSLEAWHRALKISLSSEHPSIWRFFEVMKEEFILSINHAAEVDRSATQQQKYIKITADLQRYQQSFMNGTTGMLQFLTQCSNKIKFGP